MLEHHMNGEKMLFFFFIKMETEEEREKNESL